MSVGVDMKPAVHMKIYCYMNLKEDNVAISTFLFSSWDKS